MTGIGSVLAILAAAGGVISFVSLYHSRLSAESSCLVIFITSISIFLQPTRCDGHSCTSTQSILFSLPFCPCPTLRPSSALELRASLERCSRAFTALLRGDTTVETYRGRPADTPVLLANRAILPPSAALAGTGREPGVHENWPVPARPVVAARRARACQGRAARYRGLPVVVPKSGWPAEGSPTRPACLNTLRSASAPAFAVAPCHRTPPPPRRRGATSRPVTLGAPPRSKRGAAARPAPIDRQRPLSSSRRAAPGLAAARRGPRSNPARGALGGGPQALQPRGGARTQTPHGAHEAEGPQALQPRGGARA